MPDIPNLVVVEVHPGAEAAKQGFGLLADLARRQRLAGLLAPV